MNGNQFNGILRAVVPGVVAYAVGKGWVSESQAADIGAAIITLIMAGWSYGTNHEKPAAPPNSSSGGRFNTALWFGLGIIVAMASWGSSAADLKKAPTAPRAAWGCTQTGGCAVWYTGLGIQAHGQNIDVLGQGFNGSIAAGGYTPTGSVGGFTYNGAYMFGAEAGCGYGVNMTGPAPNGFDCYQELQFGGNLAGALGITPATVPSGILTAPWFPYAAIGAEQRQRMSTGTRGGAGIKFLLGPRDFIDAGYRYVNSGPQTVGGTVTNGDNRFTLTYQHAFAPW